jgi:phosphatidylglycerophosphate synthase
VTGAVLFAAPGMAERLADVARQLRAAGVAEVHPVGGSDVAEQLRAAAAIVRSSAQPLLLCTADLVANDSVPLILATEPGARTYALTSAAPGTVSEERGRVTAVGGPAGAAFLGALRVAVSDLPAAAERCERAAEKAGAGGAATDLLLTALVESGVPVWASRIRFLHAERVTGADALPAALAAVAAVDDDAARLRFAVKERDDFFTTYFVSPYSPYLARWAARRGLSPAAVTAASVGLAALAAGAFAIASRPAMVSGAVLLYAAFVLDCVDGQLARYARRFSAFGGWLDTMADRAKEYLVYAGLAAGAATAVGAAGAATAAGNAWWLAVAAMALQTVRHMTDTWYGLLHDEAVARRAGSPVNRMDRGGMLGRVSDRVLADAGSVAYWLKRIVVFPIGERWATIAVTAALFNGRVALIVVLVWSGLAAAYTLCLRALRSWRMRVPVLTTVDVARQRDDGPLARRVLGQAGASRAGANRPGAGRAGGAARLTAPLATAALAAVAGALLVIARGDWYWAVAVVVLAAGLSARADHAGPLDWLVPAALRAAEYLFVIGIGVAGEVPRPLVFALLFVLALHHYDLTARSAAKQHIADLGWDGRVVLLALSAAAGVATPVMGVLAVYLGVVLGIRAVNSWLPRAGKPGQARPPAGVHSRAQTGKV